MLFVVPLCLYTYRENMSNQGLISRKTMKNSSGLNCEKPKSSYKKLLALLNKIQNKVNIAEKSC